MPLLGRGEAPSPGFSSLHSLWISHLHVRDFRSCVEQKSIKPGLFNRSGVQGSPLLPFLVQIPEAVEPFRDGVALAIAAGSGGLVEKGTGREGCDESPEDGLRGLN